MENNKEYAVAVHLSTYDILQGDDVRPISPDFSGINMSIIKTPKEEKEARRNAYLDFKKTLDSLEGEGSQKTLESLFWMDKTDEEFRIGDVSYMGVATEGISRSLVIHKMSYDEYLELGKQSSLEITRICADKVKAPNRKE